RLPEFQPDFIFFHAPSLHDRGKPWRVLETFLKLRAFYPRARILPEVHEYMEAPFHWKARQAFLLLLSRGGIVHSRFDFEALKRFRPNLLKTHQGPSLSDPVLLESPTQTTIADRI